MARKPAKKVSKYNDNVTKWKVIHPAGHVYYHKDLTKIALVYGFSVEDLKERGWTFEGLTTSQGGSE